MKNFIYFFKHKEIPAIKIGRTTRDSVNIRFSQFKTYSPYGSEIIGFFECENCIELERKIHIELKQFRLHGEFFNITEEHAKSIINKYDNSFKKIKYIFNEWIANPENNVEELQRLIKNANAKIAIDDEEKETIESEKLREYFTHGFDFMTTTQILNIIIKNDKDKHIRYNINKIGAALKKLNFNRVSIKGNYGYLVRQL